MKTRRWIRLVVLANLREEDKDKDDRGTKGLKSVKEEVIFRESSASRNSSFALIGVLSVNARIYNEARDHLFSPPRDANENVPERPLRAAQSNARKPFVLIRIILLSENTKNADGVPLCRGRGGEEHRPRCTFHAEKSSRVTSPTRRQRTRRRRG